MTRKKISAIFGIFLIVVFGAVYFLFFSAPKWSGNLTDFVVGLGATQTQIDSTLKSEGFIKSVGTFDFILKIRDIKEINPGSYKISKAMNVWQTASVLSGKAALVWVVIPEGLRKEEIADLLGR